MGLLTEAPDDKSTAKPCLGLVHTEADQESHDEVENNEYNTANNTWDILPKVDVCARYGFEDGHSP